MDDISLFTFKREHLSPPETYAERCVGYQVRPILGSTPYLGGLRFGFHGLRLIEREILVREISQNNPDLPLVTVAGFRVCARPLRSRSLV
jgi:hypothetical protein